MSVDHPTEVDAFEQHRMAVKVSTRTLIPGFVTTYDPLTRKAAVQPSRMGSNLDGTPYLLPIVSAAPVLWPRFAGMIIVGRRNPGDTLILAVLDRELDQFLISPPSAPHLSKAARCHSLTDAVVVLGLSQDLKPVAPPANPAFLHVGREDLQAFIQIGIDAPITIIQGTPTIQLGPLAVEPVIKGTTSNASHATLGGAWAAFGVTMAAAGVTHAASAKLPPDNAAYITSLIAAHATLITAWATWTSALASWLSAKVLTE